MADGSGDTANLRHTSKMLNMFDADAMVQSDGDFANSSGGGRNSSASSSSDCHSERHEGSPCDMSPSNPASSGSPFARSPWAYLPILSNEAATDPTGTGLVGSLVREEGHVYSLVAAGDLLYTGSESRNIRVWKGQCELSGFKSSSGLVKAIVVAGDKIFTGHQDGKIRVWRRSSNNPSIHRRVGTLPRLQDFLKSSINPSNYVQVRRHRNAVWLRHFDAVSCLGLDGDAGILYSGSWDRTVKAWRISDSKCLESIMAHDDAVNSVAAGFGGFLFTGSADGTLKVWRREAAGRGDAVTTRHVLVQTLLRLESAVTAVAVAEEAGVVYCGSSDGAVNFWRWDSGKWGFAHGGVLQGHRMAVLCLAAAGNLVASGSADRTLCVWRREEGTGRASHRRLAVLAGHEGPIKCLEVVAENGGGEWDGGDLSRGQRYLVYSGSLDNSVKVWRVLEREAAPVAHDEGLRRRSGDAGEKLVKLGSTVAQGLVGRPARVQAAA